MIPCIPPKILTTRPQTPNFQPNLSDILFLCRAFGYPAVGEFTLTAALLLLEFYMTVTVRTAEKNEYAAIARLARQVHNLHADHHPDRFSKKEHYMSKDIFQDYLDNPDCRIFVALDDTKIIGMAFCSYSDLSKSPAMAMKGEVTLYSMCVAKTHQRHGTGRVLISTIESWAAEKGADAMKLNVHVFNNAAMDLYTSSGFTALAVVMTKPIAKISAKGPEYNV